MAGLRAAFSLHHQPRAAQPLVYWFQQYSRAFMRPAAAMAAPAKIPSKISTTKNPRFTVYGEQE
jgi:hypothetical protein